jgi:hypothetical protein
VHADVNWTFGPLRYVLVSPAFHRWHHSKQPEAIDKNFATVLPLWDVIFGTLYFPKGETPGNFGVHENLPENLVGQMIYPFVQATRPIQPPLTTAPKMADRAGAEINCPHASREVSVETLAAADCSSDGAVSSDDHGALVAASTGQYSRSRI